ncbi:MAG: PfkB family carbohydrate kinase [Pseudomonadota bacterium]
MTQPHRIPKILSVGRLYCDLIFGNLPRLPNLGTEVFAREFSIHAGGGAFITAAHLSALGHPSALAAMLPSSPFADLIACEFQRAEIDTSQCRHLPDDAGPQLTVAMAHRGDRAFLTRRVGPAFPELTPQDIKSLGVQHIHVGELASLAAQPEIIKVARALGLTVSLDCGWDEDLRSDAIRPLIGAVDVFLPNEPELQSLRQMGIVEAFAPLTVVKRGAAGAVAMAGEETIKAPTEPIRAVDTTGAGDAFNAGFLSAWLAHKPLADCLAAGNARGATTVRRFGGFAADEPAAVQMG